MADPLLSPAVGGAMWAVSGATVAAAARSMRRAMDDAKIPLMGVLGAFVFAAQMVNFTIPATGSSGHLGGGLILAALLGPAAAFLTMASILTVQALFFADGGLLALGCNVFNLGFVPAFVAYPLVFRPIVGDRPGVGRLTAASLAGAVIGLQLGAFGVVAETALSGVSELPFAAFVLVMQPIHLAIGLAEGIVTASVVSFVWKARPEVVEGTARGGVSGRVPAWGVIASLAVAAALTGGVLSWFGSSRPDGLEWAIERVTGGRGVAPRGGVHEGIEAAQGKTSILPGYRLPGAAEETGTPAPPSADGGSSLSGLVGGAVTLLLAGGIGLAVRRRRGGAL